MRQPSPPLRAVLGGAAAAALVWGAAGFAPPAAATPSAAPAAPAPTPAPPAEPHVDPWAASPYMGWSSYSMQVYSGNSKWITGNQLIAQSDAMHAKLQSAGYDYINVDSGWNDGFDGHGRPTPSATLYPDGFQTIIDHVHANGQKFGVYMIPGIDPSVAEHDLPINGAPGCTTGEIVAQPTAKADYWGIDDKIDFTNPCAQKYIDSIVDELADWGVDFVKFDSVTPGSGVSDLSLDARDDVAAWSQALKSHGIWFELSWALDPKYADYWRSKANGWRIEWDVECYCAKSALTQWSNIDRLFDDEAVWWRHGGNGGWNDLDSLDIGNGSMDGLTRDERQTAMTLWATSAAPLYTGDDLTTLDDYGVQLLTNPEVIAVDQTGVPLRPVSTATQQQTWWTLNADGSYTVALYNLGRTAKNVPVDWSDLGLDGGAKVRDLWTHKNLGTFTSGYTAANVPVHGSRLLRVTPRSRAQISVNDDSLRVDYSGSWTRNNGNEITATSQPLTVTVTNDGTVTPSSGGATQTTTLDDTDPGIQYTGSWGQSTNRGLGDYGDGVHYTENNGDSFSYTFRGTGIDYVTEKDASQGNVDVYLDGTLVDTVNTGLDPGAPRQVQQTVFSAKDLQDQTHTLKVVKKSGSFMLLDRLDVYRPSLITPSTVGFDKQVPADATVTVPGLGDALSGISYEDAPLLPESDYTVSGDTVTIMAAYLTGLPTGSARLAFTFRGDHLDDIHAATENGDSASLTFSGTSVQWIGPTAPDQGLVDVYIDGKRVDRVDTHSDNRTTQQVLYSSPSLNNGEHTFMAVKASGDLLRNDVIRYTTK